MEQDWGNLATVSCNLCRTRRHYMPEDLIAIFGDMEIDRVERRMRCEDCGKRDYVHVRFWRPLADEPRPKIIRRLVRMKTIRRPVWRDESYLGAVL